MFQRKLMNQQMISAGVRMGDSCSIYPLHGKKKAFTLNRKCIDLVSQKYRPDNLSLCYIELPTFDVDPFHYRLELEESIPKEPRFVLKTMKGEAFWLNGLAVKEAYVERLDRLYIDDNKLNFFPDGLTALTQNHFDHSVLYQENLIKSDLKILIQGETGTGKTHLAQKIHEKSSRIGQFVSVNLSSFNHQLIESELFGHKKGSFTGAVSDKCGAFSLAEEGTLFLDEIDSLPLEIQTKLLTFIDEKKYRRVGDTKENQIKTRIIFASGRPLENLIKQNLLRQDFYYRLKSGHTILLPSLRSDVKLIKQACQYYSLKHSITFSKRLTDFFETLAWPGNLRQLLGHLDKKRILSNSTKLDFDQNDEELLLQSSDLMNLTTPSEIIPLDELRAQHVKIAYNSCDGNLAMTARKLQVSQKTVKSIIRD
jgi:transcriptional regulator of acetoin/glycerol metabolism